MSTPRRVLDLAVVVIGLLAAIVNALARLPMRARRRERRPPDNDPPEPKR